MGFTIFENYNGTRAYLANTIDHFYVVELDDVKYLYRFHSAELKDKMGARAYRILRESSDTALAVPISKDKGLLKRIEEQHYSELIKSGAGLEPGISLSDLVGGGAPTNA